MSGKSLSLSMSFYAILSFIQIHKEDDRCEEELACR